MDAISDVSRGTEIFSSVPVFPPHPQPLTIDDLFGFTEAGRKKLIEEKVEPKYFVGNKIFINHVDSFTGKRIVSFLLGKQGKFQQGSVDNVNQSESEKEKTIDVGIQDDKKPYVQKTDNIPYFPRTEITEDFDEDLCCTEEKLIYDTSKLTVSEYYEMMEIESYENRSQFLKDKLGKFYVDSCDTGVSKHELEPPFQSINSNSNDRECEFEIFGTLKNHNTEEIEGVTEIIHSTYKDSEFWDQLVKCGIIIYCVHEDLDQTLEATWILNYILNFLNDMKNKEVITSDWSPKFVLVSTFMTWTLTKPLSLDEELPFIEEDHRKRKPHPNYKFLFELEELVLKAKYDHSIKSAIIVSGIPYGHEQNELRYLFENALYYKNLPIYSYANNIVPTVHVENLGQIIKQTISRIDNVKIPFIFAKDPVQNSIADITKAISLSLGTGYCEFHCKEDAFVNEMISQDLFNKITSKIYLESCYPLFKEEDIVWKYDTGFTENISSVVNEFINAKSVKPLRIIFYGVSKSSRLKNLAQNVSKFYNVPYISPKNITNEFCDEVLRKKATFEEQKLLLTPEMQNIDLSKSSAFPMKPYLCGDEKCIENELEICKQLNNSDNESEKIRILARKLQMKPYIYLGYIMEEYPQNVEHANLLFSEKSKDVFKGNSSDTISIIPNFIILLNEIKGLNSQEHADLNNQSQENEEHDYDVFQLSKKLEESEPIKNYEVNNSKGVEEEYSNVKSVLNTNDVTSAETQDSMHLYSTLAFFSNLDEQCQTITLDIEETDIEDKIFSKIVDIIQKTYFPDEQRNINSIIINDQQQSSNTNTDEENKYNQMLQNLKSQDDIEIENTEKIKEAEEIILAVRSYPLISYLINFIFPTLTNGILGITEQMPEDPIEFLAEYIFKNNPDGRMMPQNEFKLEELMRNQKKPIPKIDSKACFA